MRKFKNKKKKLFQKMKKFFVKIQNNLKSIMVSNSFFSLIKNA